MIPNNTISVSNLRYRYNKNKEVLHRLNFEVHSGEIFGFLGPSGAGKSTTQKILIGLLNDYHGSVKFNGKEIREYSEEIYNHIGVSFEQSNHYLKLTGRENLEFYKSLYEVETRDIDELLKMVGLAESANVRVQEYSKGMKVRLNFARSLLHNPEILFLDEVTAGLDPVNTQNIINIIQGLKNRGTTIVLTTHNMFVADELCDRVAFIVDGEIKTINSPKELKLRHGRQIVSVEYTNSKPAVIHSTEFPLDNLGNNEVFLELISNNTIRTIHSQEATLDQVFRVITGRDLQ